MGCRYLLSAMMGFFCLALAMPAFAQSPYPEAIFLLNYTQYGVQTCGNGTVHPPSDYRPSIDAGGTRVVYERSIFDCSQYKYPLDGGGDLITYLYVSDIRFQLPAPLAVPGSDLALPVPLYGHEAARADWCPVRSATSDGLISFSTGAGIYVVDPDKSESLHLLNNTKGLYYPAWYPSCLRLATKKAVAVNGGPSSVAINATTGAFLRNLSGQNTWAGFVSVSPVNPQLVVFAGQPVGSNSYNEDYNYIYLADETTTPPKVRPLDPKTPVNSNNFNGAYQGRAPTFSPDGRWVAFESDRNCPSSNPNGVYALFIQRTNGSGPAMQVTDCSYNAQHARWIPPVPGTNQTVLIAAAYQPNVSPPAFGVAAFDISAFIK